MKKIIVIFLSAIVTFCNAQDTNKLSVEFGSGMNYFAMKSLNQYYLDDFAIPFEIFDKEIKQGYNFSLSIRYKPVKYFDFSIYEIYQRGTTKWNSFISMVDSYGYIIDSTQMDNLLTTDAVCAGITIDWLINEMFNFQEKDSKFLQRFTIATELNASIGFSKVIIDSEIKYYPQGANYYYYYFNAMDFQSHLALKLEYT